MNIFPLGIHFRVGIFKPRIFLIPWLVFLLFSYIPFDLFLLPSPPSIGPLSSYHLGGLKPLYNASCHPLVPTVTTATVMAAVAALLQPSRECWRLISIFHSTLSPAPSASSTHLPSPSQPPCNFSFCVNPLYVLRTYVRTLVTHV